MTPERKIEVKGHKIKEYYWAGKMVVYIDNRAYDGNYEEAIKKIKANDN